LVVGSSPPRPTTSYFEVTASNADGLQLERHVLAADACTGLLKNSGEQNRTLYSLRHTYATQELLRKGTDIHTLSRQMGNSAAMIERHYSKLTANMAADKLA